MSTVKTCFYRGEVMHRRLRPRHHRLKYRVFSLLVDLDALPELDRTTRFFSLNRFNLLGFHCRDHGAGDTEPKALKAHICQLAAAAGIGGEISQVLLLCYPRILGYVFNPLSVYFCYGSDDALVATLYEVGNTFAERHTYVIAADGGSRLDQRADKLFYVSPFLEVAGTYRFRVRPPDTARAGLEIAIQQSDNEGPVLYAAFKGTRRPFSDRDILGLWLRHPLMTVKVIAAIHWEALRLWAKRIPWHRHRVKGSPAWTAGQLAIGRRKAS